MRRWNTSMFFSSAVSASMKYFSNPSSVSGSALCATGLAAVLVALMPSPASTEMISFTKSSSLTAPCSSTVTPWYRWSLPLLCTLTNPYGLRVTVSTRSAALYFA